jgi:hypothetical protein
MGIDYDFRPFLGVWRYVKKAGVSKIYPFCIEHLLLALASLDKESHKTKLLSKVKLLYKKCTKYLIFRIPTIPPLFFSPFVGVFYGNS